MKHQSIYNRLRRIEGQIRGLEEMIAKDRSSAEILIQLEAAKSSLSSTVGAFIESIFESKKQDGTTTLSEDELGIILRIVKK
jgi:DNA-binding FrmR family transcriptional regulator